MRWGEVAVYALVTCVMGVAAVLIGAAITLTVVLH
jgi:hypothetical protein